MSELLRAAARPQLAWANGAGATTEVARGGDEPFDWRISIATIDRDAPFSPLPGVDRILVPLSTGGLTLLVDGAEVALDRYEPFVFSGETGVAATGVASVSLDLNVMTRRGSCVATLELQSVDGKQTVAATRDLARIIVVVDAAEPLKTDGVTLLSHDAMLVREQPIQLRGNGLVAVVTIRATGEGAPA